jgi:putative acyl-CoA dehydrogenase
MPGIASAFGRALIEQPLMRNVLADLALESEAATALTFRVARAVDASRASASEAALARVIHRARQSTGCASAAPPFVNEAQECLGGIGYVEDSSMPRLLRQAPLNSIWEGSGNIQCLDVLRALQREPACLDAYFAELALASGGHRCWMAKLARCICSSGESPRHWRGSRAGWSNGWPWPCRPACSCAPATRPWPMRFATVRLGSRHGLAFGTLAAGCTDRPRVVAGLAD